MDLALLARLAQAGASDSVSDVGAPGLPSRSPDVVVVDDNKDGGEGVPGAEAPESRIVAAPADLALLARLGNARNEDLVEKRRRQTQAARTAKSQSVVGKRKCPTSSEYAVALCSAAPMAKSARLQKVHPVSICDVAAAERGMTEVTASALQVMAMIPRLRGGGLARELRWQRLGARLMASAIQRLQAEGLARFLRGFAADQETQAGAELFHMLGVNCMWDEATQHMKGALDNTARYRAAQSSATLRLTTMPVRATTMIVLTRLYLDVPSDQGRSQQWEPWAPLSSVSVVCPQTMAETYKFRT